MFRVCPSVGKLKNATESPQMFFFFFLPEVDSVISLTCLQVLKLKEQLEMTVQKLNESKEVLKTNENGEIAHLSLPIASGSLLIT